MASLTQWTWVSVNSGSWWWTGSLGMLQSMALQKIKDDWVTELSLHIYYFFSSKYFRAFSSVVSCIHRSGTWIRGNYVPIIRSRWLISCGFSIRGRVGAPKICIILGSSVFLNEIIVESQRCICISLFQLKRGESWAHYAKPQRIKMMPAHLHTGSKRDSLKPRSCVCWQEMERCCSHRTKFQLYRPVSSGDPT